MPDKGFCYSDARAYECARADWSTFFCHARFEKLHVRFGGQRDPFRTFPFRAAASGQSDPFPCQGARGVEGAFEG
eukprot:3209179-Alexandrium_andersonii.AAC.1